MTCLLVNLSAKDQTECIDLRVGNLILTALAIGRVTLRNAAKNLQFALTQDILTLTWVGGRVLHVISISVDKDSIVFLC